jgi:hypothetical protein
VDAETYLELARREDERARTASERSEAARRFALRQPDEGLSDHFLRVSGRAEMEAVAHVERARHYEGIAATCERAAARARRLETERARSQANAELLKRVLAGILHSDFDVPPEYLPGRAGEPSSRN